MQNKETHYACANAARVLAVSAIEQAQSGHPGVVLGFADVLTVLWRQHIRYDLAQPNWQNRDRFVLSNGHASAVYYAILHCCGFDLTMDDLRAFRQLNSQTPGHPERDVTLGIDVATGPLGQGLANAVGMAMAGRYMAHQVRMHDASLVNYFTYVAVGDGCLMEGISHESASLAGRLGLGQLIVCWDDNGISIDGSVDQWSERSVADRFKSYGWQVIECIDGHCPEAINQAIEQAKLCTDQPSLLCFKTVIGRDTDLSGQSEVHGKPLGTTRFTQLKQSLAWSYDDFFVPDSIYAAWQEGYQPGVYEVWCQKCQLLPQSLQAQLLLRGSASDDGDAWQTFWESFLVENDGFQQRTEATRHSSQALLRSLMHAFPMLIGGSADLTESTGVHVPSIDAWGKAGMPGRFIHFGVREFAMFAIANGLATCFDLRPFVSTFLVFSDYGINAVRMAALMKLPVIFIFSHDSVVVGEDGPTHQPIEHLSHLRAIPGLEVWRPSDVNETALAWRQVLHRRDGPSCLILSRQKLPSLCRFDAVFAQGEGACRYDALGHDVHGVFIATGSEVALAIEAHTALLRQGIRMAVVSMISVERFRAQGQEVQAAFLPMQGFCIIVEAGATQCWYRFLAESRCLGEVMGIDAFAASGKGEDVYQQAGFMVDALCRRAMCLFETQTASIDA